MALLMVLTSQPLSIDENTLSQLKIFPNPTANNIQIFGLTNFAKIYVFSSDGRQLSTTTVSSEGKIDLNVASGIYFIKIVSENILVVKKLVVK